MILGFDRIIFPSSGKLLTHTPKTLNYTAFVEKILSQHLWKRIGRPYTHSSRFRTRIKIMRVLKLNSISNSRSTWKSVSNHLPPKTQTTDKDKSNHWTDALITQDNTPD